MVIDEKKLLEERAELEKDFNKVVGDYYSQFKLTEILEKIEQRNTRVELDKAWEVSFVRKIIIALLTYLIIVLFFYAANLPKPFINSIVPTTGYVLSTLSLPYFKKWWIKYFKK